MSEESKEDKKRGAAGGSFEQGMRSALEKAPGLAAPGWLTMQSAMAGGAAGGAAAASWRWVIGPAAGAALIGGALWFSQPDAEAPVENDPVGQELSSNAVEDSPETGWFEGLVDAEDEDNESADLGDAEAEAPSIEANHSADDVATTAPEILEEKQAPVEVDAVDVPEDWAELPAEKAAAFGAEIDAACVGTEIGFRMANPMNDVRVLWNFGDGQFSSETGPQHVFNAPGTYDITLSITRISDGLIRTRTIENLVTIHPNPQADFTWDVPTIAAERPVVRMRNRSRDATSATWIVDGESTVAGESAAFSLDRVGEHVVQLVASSPHGCQSVMSHAIEVGNRFGIGGSGRFSPNGDGIYDRFIPRGLMQLELPYVFRVENQAGNIVFETTVPKAWDGTLPGGGKAAPGQTFMWSVVVQGKDGPAYFSDAVIVE